MLHHFNHIHFSTQPTPPSLYAPNPRPPPLTTPSQSNPKLRAACDECRLKKLKCTGEQPACSRCVREGIQCIYSPQKPMGRPKKKRQRVGAAEEEEDGEAFYPQQQLQEGHLAPLQPASKPDQVRGKDLGLPSFGMDFSQANGNTTAAAAAAAADVTTTSDWTSWEDFERFLGNGGEELYPWLSSNNWSAEVPAQDALPELTPDFATNFHSEGITPPVLNLPSELLLPRQAGMGKDASNGGVGWGVGEGDVSREANYLSDGGPVLPRGGRGAWGDDLNLDSTLLPSTTTTTALPLTPPPPDPQDRHQQQPSLLPTPSCACLSTLYLTLSTLQQQPSSSSPPSSSFPHTLTPLRTAMQTATSILTCPYCPQKFLSAMQNTQLLGTLLVSMYDRQLAWHSSTKEVVDAADGKVKTIPSLPEDFPHDREGKPIGGPSVRREDHMCLKFRGFAEKLVEGLDWS
ncbi:hypothetical protein D0867_08056 [Hortaea werneckii]|uniref:Zn(2)-C6 fungal-type domain-containing protein n=1 Tax=Hortaea werneckii TaxID=91943 RepID=A0A3M6Z8G2_HORWE|nr:hypothetical protein D0867_08056 [Hortaea werneckii]RMY27899.1 hypothetical protein D0866_09813 [Hortaea werneckii]